MDIGRERARWRPGLMGLGESRAAIAAGVGDGPKVVLIGGGGFEGP
jgi:hypothetical protein